MAIRRYLQKISGPLLDRIDLRLFVDRPSRVEIADSESGESSATIRSRVIAARARSQKRFQDEPWQLNSEIPAPALRKKYAAQKPAMAFLHTELDEERLSARGFHKVLRTSWSIADSLSNEVPTLDDVKFALSLREAGEINI